MVDAIALKHMRDELNTHIARLTEDKVSYNYQISNIIDNELRQTNGEFSNDQKERLKKLFEKIVHTEHVILKEQSTLWFMALTNSW
jgi:hypothetical protein